VRPICTGRGRDVRPICTGPGRDVRPICTGRGSQSVTPPPLPRRSTRGSPARFQRRSSQASSQTSSSAARSPPPLPRTKWTRRVPHPVLIGHAVSHTGVLPRVRDAVHVHRLARRGERHATPRRGAALHLLQALQVNRPMAPCTLHHHIWNTSAAYDVPLSPNTAIVKHG